jgi:hypothetical protein
MRRLLVTTAICVGCASAGSALAWMGHGGTTPGFYYDQWAPALFSSYYYEPAPAYVPSYVRPYVPAVRYRVMTLVRATTRVVRLARVHHHKRPVAVAHARPVRPAPTPAASIAARPAPAAPPVAHIIQPEGSDLTDQASRNMRILQPVIIKTGPAPGHQP